MYTKTSWSRFGMINSTNEYLMLQNCTYKILIRNQQWSTIDVVNQSWGEIYILYVNFIFISRITLKFNNGLKFFRDDIKQGS